MRGVLLLSLLMGIALMAYLFTKDAAVSVKAKQQTESQMAPVTGRGPDGGTMTDSAEFDADKAGLAVTSVKPGSYFDVYFGLKQGDVITKAGDVDLKGSDVTSGTTFVYQAAQSKRSFDVLRAGQKTTLDVKTPQ
ncbi:MAG: hypothetical protein JWO31_1125 [Phycisphaerales bacterium]|nr:hypothetical protein [Phycisphaerales bacterium]